MISKDLTLTNFSPRNWFGMALAVVGVALFFVVNRAIAPALVWFSPLANDALNDIARYQVTMLVLTVVLLILWLALFPAKFRAFARFGDQHVHALPVGWLGIKATETWRSVGINFAVVVSLATALFMFFGGLEGDLSRLQFGYLGIALLFALSNSFIEEAITRFGVVVSLHGVLPDRNIALISGLIFGIPHYFGTPGGPLGAVMALFLGWLLAKSILETRGIFWAWFIHFIQDVIIFLVIASMAVS